MGQAARAITHKCGVRSAWTTLPDPQAAASALAEAIGSMALAQLVVFFSPTYPADDLARALAARFPGAPLAACSSAGEISPDGGLDRGLVAIAFPQKGFRIVSTLVRDLSAFDAEQTAASVSALRCRLAGEQAAEGGRFALTLIDGLADAEEQVVSAIDRALAGVPLVGGSAGDDLSFRRTALIYDGEVATDAAIVMICDTDFPVETFKTDNFEPTEVKFVVTASDDGARTVRELNAEPAAAEYAMAVGLDPRNLTPMSFASHPLVVRVGGEYFCRSIRRLNADGSLSFFCAIDRGLVLTLARPKDIVEVTRAELERLEASLGGVDLIIGFDCVLRRLDAEIRQKRRTISSLYRQYGVIGFETYGEQYRSMHLNQTFTGVAIGFAESAP